MRMKKRLLAVGLMVLLLAAAYGLVRTRPRESQVSYRLVITNSIAAPGSLANLTATQAPLVQAPVVDDTPLTTAQELARAGISPDEVPLAQEALRVADHEVDLAFAAALHDAKEHPPVLKGEAKQIAERLQKAEKLAQDQQARVQQLTQSVATFLAGQHDALDKRLEQEKIASPHLGHHAKQAAGAVAAPTAEANRSHEESAALLTQTKRISADEKALTTLDKRVEAQKELAAVYSHWIAVVAGKQRAVVQRALIGVVIILGILLVGLFFDDWLETLLGRTSLDRRQVETLRTVTRVAVQVFAVLFILLVIIGPPGQLGTFLGLAGAGLTVALKDFIVGFLGWLGLLGKNGIRLGDWVEINGGWGEVVLLGLFPTVLLGKRYGTETRRPSVRRVAVS